MELFSEIYGCYFTVVNRILEDAQKGLTKKEIEELVENHGFYESTFHLLPTLFSKEWNLLEEKDKKYYSKTSKVTKRPMSSLEKSWLKALIADPRMKLFLEEEAYQQLKEALEEIVPLYQQEDFYLPDQHGDGDSYEDEKYILRFKKIIKALREGKALSIAYIGPKSNYLNERVYYPYRLIYSSRDDKFRLQCGVYNKRKKALMRTTLNLERMVSVKIEEDSYDVKEKFNALFSETGCEKPVVLEISTKRNALERSMLQFSSFKKQTEYDPDRQIYTSRIWYDVADETELLIRILSFGPMVKVIEPEGFLEQVKERIKRQMRIEEKKLDKVEE